MSYTNSQLETTTKVYALREKSKNDDELAKTIGIAKGTLYTRLKKNNWKAPEISHIKNLYEDLK